MVAQAPVKSSKVGPVQKVSDSIIISPTSSIADLQKVEEIMTPTLTPMETITIPEMQAKTIRLMQREEQVVETEGEIHSPISVKT